jgi:hypothetical protein
MTAAVIETSSETLEAMAARYVRQGGILPNARAGHFDREALPEPMQWLAQVGIEGPRERRGVWRTYFCPKHGGWSLRVNTTTGSWACMSGCGSGGDLIAFEQWRTGASFIEAAKALGCWRDDPSGPLVRTDRRPAGLSASDALSLLRADFELVAIAALRIARGRGDERDRRAVLEAAERIRAVLTTREASHAV